MHKDLVLEHCKVRFWSQDDPLPELRQILCDSAGFEIITDEDDLAYEHCYPLDKYILRGKILVSETQEE